MSKKLLIKTWGCQMNEYDSSKMADLLNAANGYELTEVPEEADVLLLNTCSIREKAQEKVFHQLGRWKTLKDKKEGVEHTHDDGTKHTHKDGDKDHTHDKKESVEDVYATFDHELLKEMTKKLEDINKEPKDDK